MKKFLSLLMAVVATVSVFAFATACTDGKCDGQGCDKEKGVEVYVWKDSGKEVELCPECALRNIGKVELKGSEE